MTETNLDQIALQMELEKLYSKNQLMPRIKKEFTDCEFPNFKEFFAANEIPEHFGYDLLVQMVLHKRTTVPTLVGILKHHFDSAQACADEIYKCALLSLVDYKVLTGQFIVVFDISKDVQEELDRYQFPLPMVMEPKTLTTNRQSAYYLNTSSVILKDNHHEEDVCLEHLNRVNKVKFKINHRVVRMIKNSWKNLDKKKECETDTDFKRRVRAFEKYDRTAKDVMDKLLSLGNGFWLTHRYDKRGRTYCQGYHVNYQGTPWNKAVIELEEGELVEG